MGDQNQPGEDGKTEVPSGKANPKYADSLFTMLFQTKEDILELHRTLHPGDPITLDSIRICTLRNVVINNRYNDLAYMAGERLIIMMEHQSTRNPNMPLRLFLYLALEYERIIQERKLNIFSETLQKFPKPEFYIVYTGVRDWETEVLKLSDAFGEAESEWLQLRVKVIKKGQDEIKGSILEQYLELIATIQKYKKPGIPAEEAIRLAINDCMARGILTEFLRERNKEVSRVLLDQCIEVDLVELERQRAEKEIEKAKQEAEQERRKAEQERRKAEQEYQRAEQERRKAVGMLKDKNFSDAEIKDMFRASYGLTEEQAQSLLDDYYSHKK